MLSFPRLYINAASILYYTDYMSLARYVGFTITTSHKNDSDMLRQMRMLYARSNRLVRLFYSSIRNVLIELGRNFCVYFYCSYLRTHYNRASFSKICVAYNNFYNRILPAPYLSIQYFYIVFGVSKTNLRTISSNFII